MNPIEFTIQPLDQAGFPDDICLTSPEHSKQRRYIEVRYGAYSETLVWRNTVKTFPDEFGIKNYGPRTWRTKAMRNQISEIVADREARALVADKYAVIPGHACEHLHMRIGSYRVRKRRYRIHNGLKGSEACGVSSYIMLESNVRKGAGHRQELFEIWRHLMASNQWNFITIGEYWRYGRLFVKSSNRLLSAEIWYDSRPWSPRERLPRMGDILGEKFPEVFSAG